MRRIVLVVVGSVAVVLVLAAGAFVGGRLLAAAASGSSGQGTVRISTGDGREIRAQFVQAEEMPDADPGVTGAFARRQDNSLFIDKTEGGFAVAVNEDGSLSVTNTTGQIAEVVVTGQTLLYVDKTFENPEAALSDGKLYQQLRPGSIDEIGELSFVRAWGEMRGDRLIASIVVYSPAPVLPR